MIRINRQTDYAIRILLALSRQNAQNFLTTSQIQQEMLIPRAMCLRVVAELAKDGFIHTHPGRDGGLLLARLPIDINLYQVVTHFENDLLSQNVCTKVTHALSAKIARYAVAGPAYRS